MLALGGLGIWALTVGLGPAGLAMGAIYMVGAGAVGWLFLRQNGSYASQQATFLGSLGRLGVRDMDRVLAPLWGRCYKPPRTSAIVRALKRAEAPELPRARIVCFAPFGIPSVGALRFEPEVVAPTRSLGTPLLAIPVVVVLIGLTTVLALIRHPVAGVGAFLMGLMAFGLAVPALGYVVVWVWRAGIMPRYLRLAPGIIQVIRFPGGRSKPHIKTYPVESGTLAVFRRRRGQLTLTLVRGNQTDTINLSQVWDDENVLQLTWCALLSTAPTPPLSDDDLVG